MTTAAKPDQSLVRRTFPVLEMSCAACAVSVESILKNTHGVKSANVNFPNHSATVEYEQSLPVSELQQAVRSIGYDLVIDKQNVDNVDQEHKFAKAKRNAVWSSLLSIPVVTSGMFFMNDRVGEYISFILTAIIVFYFGRNFFRRAWKQLLHRSASMDTLVVLSTGIAFLFSAFNTFFPAFWHERGMHAHVYYESAAVVIAFLSIGKLLEERATSKTSSVLRKLLTLQPTMVTIIVDGNAKEIPITDVQVNDVVLVKPGDKIAVDGFVMEGSSFVNESMMTGEPEPVAKKMNDKVFAGTINQNGSFQFKALRVGNDTFLAHIIKSVQDAQGSKAPVQKLVDKIAGVFVPVVVAIAILTFGMWVIFGNDNSFSHGLMAAVTVLVIACPCALGLATPTAIMVGIGKGAQQNILVKDAESLERAHRVDAIVFDKTGTITQGKPEVTVLQWLADVDDMKVAVLYSIEKHSEHPLAESVVRKLEGLEFPMMKPERFESITARGVSAFFSGRRYFVGSEQLMTEKNIQRSESVKQLADQLQSVGQTVIYFSTESTILAVIALADMIKPTSKAAIEGLNKKGIDTYLLTGDNQHTAEIIGKQVGVKSIRANCLPSDKADFIRALQAQGKTVAMAGDGINDAEALALADVSIAMGNGTDIAMDVAQITLITSDLQSVSRALNLSRKTIATIKQNLFWAFVYNVIGIPLAAGVLYPVNGFLLNPMIAGAAMALSSLSVVANSLRLKLAKI